MEALDKSNYAGVEEGLKFFHKEVETVMSKHEAGYNLVKDVIREFNSMDP